MKIDIHWIESAQEALEKYNIVKDGSYPKAYKGYISSLSASIIQSGLVPALSIYENDNSEDSGSADNNRALLIYAIVRMLQAKEMLPSGIYLLSDYIVSKNHLDMGELHRNINHALIALKLAIRIYKPNESKCHKRMQDKDIERFPLQSLKVDYNYNYNYSPIKNSKSNIGWLYYKDLYRNFKRFQYKADKINRKTRKIDEVDITVQHEEKLFKQKIATICSSHLKSFVDSNQRILQEISSENGFTSFSLKTTYPGLLIGSGLNHGVNSKGDIKVGFQFDYTTGLPYIPGSSIKGALRSVFPDPNIKDDAYNEPRISYISTLLKEILNVSNLDKNWVLKLGQHLFEENNNADILRDVFMDALITNVASDNGCFLGNDYITPHKKPLQEPIPIQLLKVLPEVTFTFTFRLGAVCPMLSSKNRLLLYKEILKYIGIGAKTNVGYGHFVNKAD